MKINEDEIFAAVALAKTTPDIYPIRIYQHRDVWYEELGKHPERFVLDKEKGLLWCGYKVEYLENLRYD